MIAAVEAGIQQRMGAEKLGGDALWNPWKMWARAGEEKLQLMMHYSTRDETEVLGPEEERESDVAA